MNFLHILKAFSNDSIETIVDASAQLPPSSSHAFLRQNVSIAALAVTGFNSTGFNNAFYHSLLDTPLNMNINIPDDATEPDVYKSSTQFARRLEPLIVAVAQSIYAIGSSKSGPFQPPAGNYTLELINKLVYCFYKNNSCAFIK